MVSYIVIYVIQKLEELPGGMNTYHINIQSQNYFSIVSLIFQLIDDVHIYYSFNKNNNN